MREAILAVSATIAILLAFTAGCALLTGSTDFCFWLPFGSALVCVVVALMSRQPSDVASDYLAGISEDYFNCDGFCFEIDSDTDDIEILMQVYYQSQYANPCRVWLQLPFTSNGLEKSNCELSLELKFSCRAGEFGVVKVQHSELKKPALIFSQVCAAVDYLGGKGRQLRFSRGKPIRSQERGQPLMHGEVPLSGSPEVKGQLRFNYKRQDNPTSREPVVEICNCFQETFWVEGDPPFVGWWE